ncbi:MAG: sensor histidine kinase, partial [Nannocystaceae bacterium]
REAILRALPMVMWVVDSDLRVLLYRGEYAADERGVMERPLLPLSEFLGSSCDEVVLEAHHAALRGETATVALSWLGRTWDLHVAEIEHDSLPGGEALGGEAIAVCVDVSRREKLQKALFEANKLEAVGHLAGGVAHEINTPMQYVGDNLQFMEMALERFERAFDLLTAAVGDDDPVHGKLKKLKLDYIRTEIPSAISQSLEGVDRVSKIVKALKQSALMESGPPEPINLNHIVKNAVNVSQNEWKYSAEIQYELADALPAALGVPGDLTRAVLAIVVNASQAIKEQLAPGEKGMIRIRTFATEKEIVLEIEDDGGGIPAELRDKVFHQFFTTKETGAGLGQGLTIARAIIVDRHQGTLSFDVNDGVGTTFVVKLPLPT